MQALTRSSAQTVLIAAATLVIVALVIAAMLLARYNVRARRADLRGAWRLALFVMVGYAAVWVLAAHHVPDVNQEMNSFLRYFGSTLVAAALLWVTYVAVEPYVRRFWPDGILGWTRLLSGYVRDPRVGRDVLTGCVFAAVLALLSIVYELLPPLVGRPPAIPRFQDGVSALSGISELAGKMFDHGQRRVRGDVRRARLRPAAADLPADVAGDRRMGGGARAVSGVAGADERDLRVDCRGVPGVPDRRRSRSWWSVTGCWSRLSRSRWAASWRTSR